MKKSLPKKIRVEILERDNYSCQVCGCYTTDYPHHIKKRSQGGTDDPENLVTLCRQCHWGFHDGAVYTGGAWGDGIFTYEEKGGFKCTKYY